MLVIVSLTSVQDNEVCLPRLKILNKFEPFFTHNGTLLASSADNIYNDCKKELSSMAIYFIIQIV